MNELQRIANVDGVHGYLDENGTAYLNVADVACGLGFAQTKNGVEYIRWETVNRYLSEFGFSQSVGKDDFIPENMFYRLAMKASNAAAQKFQAKVADEILPSIRKTGAYVNQAVISPDFLRRIADEMEARDRKIAELQPKATYCDKILHSDEALAISIIAQDYGLSAMAMNKLLADMKIQHRVGRTWVINYPYADMGYTVSKTFERDTTVTHTYWTQKGRFFLYNVLRKRGVLPTIEREDVYAPLLPKEYLTC